MPETTNGDPLGRERMATLLSVLGMVALAWLYLWREAVRMQSMPMKAAGMEGTAMAMASMPDVWSIGSLFLTFLMWTIMMAGMMLPSALPAILLYRTLTKKNSSDSALLPVWAFVSGYLAVWTGFSLAVTFLQAALRDGGLLTPMMASGSAWLSGGLLMIAGLYQWLPIKDVCLEKCRAPLPFFLFRWRPGASGAFRMGAEHGVFCVGCCWALMLLLFAAGVMNLLWVALIAGFVLIEKVLPRGRLIGRLAGIGMAASGAYLILANV